MVPLGFRLQMGQIELIVFDRLIVFFYPLKKKKTERAGFYQKRKKKNLNAREVRPAWRPIAQTQTLPSRAHPLPFPASTTAEPACHSPLPPGDAEANSEAVAGDNRGIYPGNLPPSRFPSTAGCSL